MYSIYLQDPSYAGGRKCILTGLTEEKFNQSWETLNNLVGIITTSYTAEDLSYEVDQEFSDFPKAGGRVERSETFTDVSGHSTAVDTRNFPGFKV